MRKDMETKIPDMEIPEELKNKFAIGDLERRVKALEANNIVLTALCDNYAKRSGIRVERYQNGLVVITQIG